MRLTIVNQFFPPDLAPTAHLAASLARHRAEQGDEVTVVTSRGDYVAAAGGPSGAVELPTGTGPGHVRVVRLRIPGGGKSSVLTRLEGYAGFTLGAWARLATLPPQDVVVSLTTPPYIVLSAMLHRALRRQRSAKVVLWSMDVYPDTAERFGQIDAGGALSRALRFVNRRIYPRLDHLVVLDRAMRELLHDEYGGSTPPPTTIIPNWEPADLVDRIDAAPRWEGYDRLGLADRFVVAYLGNTGTGHRFDAVVEAAGRLDDGDTAFLFVGGGVRWPELETAAAALGSVGRRPLVLHGYVDKDQTPAVLAGAHAALITLDDRSRGLMSPSKLHSCLAAGLPVLYVGPEGTNVDDAIRDHGCGVSLRSGDADGLVDAVERLRGDPGHRRRLGDAARRAFVEAYSDAVALPRFDAIIDEL